MLADSLKVNQSLQNLRSVAIADSSIIHHACQGYTLGVLHFMHVIIFSSPL